jgi:hypothetical protein
MRFAVALVLLVAAMLKAYQLATTPTLGENLLHARWFNIFVVEFELFFGIWLIFGMLPKLTWLVTTGLFVAFFWGSFYKAAILHEMSCGCFGMVQINPWITMFFDLSVIGILVLFRPTGMIFQRRKILLELTPNFHYRKIIFVVLTWLVIAIPTCYAMIAVNKIDIDELGTEFVGLDGKKVLLLTPEKWIGKEFPLLPYIEKSDIIDGLKNGQWTVILFSHNCEKCKKTLSEFITKKTPNVLCIEIPPYGEHPKDLEYVKLNKTQKWFVDTPVVMEINDLIVKKIVEP